MGVNMPFPFPAIEVFTAIDKLRESIPRETKETKLKKKLDLLFRDFETSIKEMEDLVRILTDEGTDDDEFFFLYSHRITAKLLEIYTIFEEILKVLSRVYNRNPEELIKEALEGVQNIDDKYIKRVSLVYSDAYQNNLFDFLENINLDEKENVEIFQLFNRFNFLILAWLAIKNNWIRLEDDRIKRIEKALERVVEEVVEFWDEMLLLKEVKEASTDEFADRKRIFDLLNEH